MISAPIPIKTLRIDFQDKYYGIERIFRDYDITDLDIDDIIKEFIKTIRDYESAELEIELLVQNIMDTYATKFDDGWMESTYAAEDVSEFILETVREFLTTVFKNTYFYFKQLGAYDYNGQFPFELFTINQDKTLELKRIP